MRYLFQFHNKMMNFTDNSGKFCFLNQIVLVNKEAKLFFGQEKMKKKTNLLVKYAKL